MNSTNVKNKNKKRRFILKLCIVKKNGLTTSPRASKNPVISPGTQTLDYV